METVGTRVLVQHLSPPLQMRLADLKHDVAGVPKVIGAPDGNSGGA